MGLTYLLAAEVDLPVKIHPGNPTITWPAFLQFPSDCLLSGRLASIMDDVWSSGQTFTAVKNRLSATRGFP
jgi:hypothetical protein